MLKNVTIVNHELYQQTISAIVDFTSTSKTIAREQIQTLKIPITQMVVYYLKGNVLHCRIMRAWLAETGYLKHPQL